MKLIGINGYARTGKDTVANILVLQAGFTRVAFADKLREAVYTLDPVVAYERGHSHETVDKGWMPIHLRQVIDVYGWDGYKETKFGPEIRRIVQRMGTDVGRNILGENIWVDAAFASLDPNGKYVFTDCRFDNEAQTVKDRGGQVWRVDRPGVEPVNDHISEIGLDNFNFDVRLDNDGTVSDLVSKVWHLARSL